MKSRNPRRRRRKGTKTTTLPVLRTAVAGIDIGSTVHWVCGPSHDDEPNVRTFGTTTAQLEQIAQWLAEEGVESVAMESTSVYWIPLFELLEARGFEVVLVNARHLKNVPGRPKTDMLDCQWIQLLHSHGLLRASFRPADAICAIRSLKRQCANLVEERTKAIQWMQKALDQMNVQVHRAVTDITGDTGMSIIRAIVAGQREPQQLAAYRDYRCKKSRAEIAEHLTGNWRDEHLFNLEQALALYDHIEQQIARYHEKMGEKLDALQPPERKDDVMPPHPFPTKESAIRRRGDQQMRERLYRVIGHDLLRIDGVGASVAEVVVTEVGFDLSAFPTEKDFVSWLRCSPNNPVSGGKRLKKKRAPIGSTRVAMALRMAAQSLRNSKTALGAEYRRIARAKDASVAVFAIARKLAVLIYRMLRYGTEYVDIGERLYEERFRARRLRSLTAAAKHLGFQLSPLQEATMP